MSKMFVDVIQGKLRKCSN